MRSSPQVRNHSLAVPRLCIHPFFSGFWSSEIGTKDSLATPSAMMLDRRAAIVRTIKHRQRARKANRFPYALQLELRKGAVMHSTRKVFVVGRTDHSSGLRPPLARLRGHVFIEPMC